ncbi:NAD(P)-binding protein [Xylariaceae sp. AK1471]|nr:NAD(P)-binding protein [Xylariaceae sp. AK1471]
MAPPPFDVTPEKQASFPRYFYHQLTAKPEAVSDVDLRGRTALVTGSNCGVGLEISRQLLDLGVNKLILAVRNEEKGKAAAADLSAGREGMPPDTIEVWKLDLSVYDSIVSFVDRAKKTLTRLDIAVLNAGLCPAKRTVNASTGHDEIIQVNYLSTALLAILLLPVAKAVRQNQPQPTRITLTLSEVAAWARFPVGKEVPILAALDAPGKLANNTNDRMFVSKLLGQYFLAALAKQVPTSVAIINSASPGSIHDSQFIRDIDKTPAGPIVRFILRRVGNSSAVGARMITDAAVRHGEETHGQFLSFQKVVPMVPIIYRDEGAKISGQLWKETMDELSFANVADIVKEMAGSE